MPAAVRTTTTGKLYFFVPPASGERAFTMVAVDPETGVPKKNYTLEMKEVPIEDARGNQSDYTIDSAGFQLVHHPAKHVSFLDEEEIKREYYPESAELIKSVTGASRVVFFDHTIRRRNPGAIDDVGKRQPVAQAHVDQSTKAAIDRVHLHVPDDAPELLKRRFQIINLWRPISHPAWDWPLSLCDYRSVDVEKDLAPMALIYADREGENVGVKYNPGQKWKYFRGMTPEEVVLIKCFDTVQDGSVAVLTPHTAFEDPTTPAGSPLRESIELRALVFYD
ncbi:hypothetical protein H0H92_007051 [Tricholoma furcatifolium]|nr:hypothetical protein H0H92_007051 [Tricholoma furcatifolium]